MGNSLSGSGSGEGGSSVVMSADSSASGAAGMDRPSGDGVSKGASGGASSDVTKDEIKKDVEDLVSQERVVIFSKESCPYCFDAKGVFEKMGQKYAVVELNQHPQGNGVQDVLNEMTGARTVPRVFVDGKCIGGGSDTVQLFKSGKLEEILSQDALNTDEATNTKDKK